MNRRWITRFSCCLALMLPVCTCAQEAHNTPSHTAQVEHGLINLQKALLDAEERGDASYASRAISDDFLSITTTGDTSGKAEFVRDIRPPDRPGPSSILYDFQVVPLAEDCAVVSYQAVFPGSPLERYQHLSDTWVKQGGQWKLRFQQSTLNLWSAHDLD